MNMKKRIWMKRGWLMVIMLTVSMGSMAQRGTRAGNYSCCAGIPGLTEKQKTEITALENAHRNEMDKMRAERRKTGNYATRDAYQTAVDEKVTAHRDKVRSLLNEDQKAVFDQLQSGQGQGKYARRGGRGGGPSRNCRGAGQGMGGRGFRGGW